MTNNQEECLSVLFYMIEGKQPIPDDMIQCFSDLSLGTIVRLNSTQVQVNLNPEFDEFWNQLKSEADVAEAENLAELIQEGKINVQ